MLYRYKAQFQNFSQKILGSWLSANGATALGVVFVALTVGAIYISREHAGDLLLTPIFILFRFIMNALDGMLARAKNTASPLGEVMNEFLDVAGDIVSYAALLFIFERAFVPLFFVANAIWMCEFFGVLGKALPGGRRRQESFLGGKPERAVWLGLILLVNYFNPEWMRLNVNCALLILCFFVVISSVLRARATLKGAKNFSYTSDAIIGR